MFAYCGNNPVTHADKSGCMPTDIHPIAHDDIHGKPASSWRKRIAILYDGRMNRYLKVMGYTIIGDNGFRNQGNELIRRLAPYHTVESYPYSTMGEFVDYWNSLQGKYDEIYIIGHGTPGELHCAGSTLSAMNTAYSYSDLQKVNADKVYLYVCHGATANTYTMSTAYYISTLTGAEIWAVKDGKLNFSLFLCVPIPVLVGEAYIMPAS